MEKSDFKGGSMKNQYLERDWIAWNGWGTWGFWQYRGGLVFLRERVDTSIHTMDTIIILLTPQPNIIFSTAHSTKNKNVFA